jgi:septum site-determining protein MinC
VIRPIEVSKNRGLAMSNVLRKRQSLTFRARSYVAFVLAPQLPIADWLEDLGASIEYSKGFFAQYPVALDLSAVELDAGAIVQLIGNLTERQIRVLGIEGMMPVGSPERLPPVLRCGHDAQSFQLPDQTVVVDEVAPQRREKMASLLVGEPVRSGQSVVFTDGDVTVIGSVGSGAEVIAGGSIHVYGTLRGRAIAGVTGNSRARIFCHRVEAELLAIDSYYKTAEDVADNLRRQPAQVWLEGKTLRISALNSQR